MIPGYNVNIYYLKIEEGAAEKEALQAILTLRALDSYIY